jgi:hypothetical protein
LTTSDKLLQGGYKGEVKCVFFRSGIEDRDHLFFLCGYSRRIWRCVMPKGNIMDPPTNWEDVIRMGMQKWQKKTSQAYLCRLVMG